jgi:N-acetylneuraminate lyase
MKKNIKDQAGLYPALITPFKEDFSLDLKPLEKIIPSHIKEESTGLYIGGTTGEGILQAEEERIRFMKEVTRIAEGNLKIIVHVGANTTSEAVRLARAAEEAGADAVSSIPPIFYKLGPRGAFEYYQELSESTSLPFIVYYIPHLSGYSMDIPEFEALFSLPRVAGIKYAHNDHFLLSRLTSMFPEILFFNGNDEILLQSLISGATGSIGLTLNFMPRVYRAIMEAYRASDIPKAEKYQRFAVRVIETILPYGSHGAAKAVMKMIGLDSGPSRKPILDLSRKEYRELEEKLRSLDFFGKR